MMELKRIKLISLIWVAVSQTALAGSENIPNITNLDCVNDFQNTMICFWEIGSSSNCSQDFALTYTDFQEKEEKCRDLQNEQLSGSLVPNKCVCNTSVNHILISESYLIRVESHGQPVGNTTIHIGSTIKPRAPSNVQIDCQKEQNCLVQWNTNYEENFIKDKLSFHVQILFKHERKVVKEDILTQLEPRYTFGKRQLIRGEDYVARVRTQPAETHGIKGPWSEWSSEAEWKNDYSLTILDLKYIIIPITCLVSVFLIVVSYVCLTRLKKTWWSNIPNPAKSKLAQSQLLQKQVDHSDGKSAAKTSCGSFFTKVVKSHKSRRDLLTQEEYNAIHYVNISGSYYNKKIIFEPKDDDIERCVKMYPKKENENTVQEEITEHNAEDHLLEEDLSIAKMFFDILCESSGIKVERNFNIGTTFGCSDLMDSFGKKETQRCNSDVSAYWESGYNSYGSSDSPLNFLSDIDQLNTPYFCHWPDNEEDCKSYIPQVTVKENCLCKKEENHLESPDYNIFANTPSDGRKDFIIDASKNVCFDSLSNIVLCKSNSHKRLLAPKSVLYYNTKHFISDEDSFQPIIRPKSEQVSGIILQCHESKSDLTSVCHVPGYQSFDQALQDNVPEYGWHISRYKGFDQAVHKGGPDSGCQLSGYQSFDQAIHDGGPDYGCQVSGDQSFDQAIYEGGPDSGCLVSGYQSFDQAVHEGRPDSGCQVSRNQSFDQQIHEGGPDFECVMSGYQSFDQAVHEGDVTSVCLMTAYQSFDQAIQQNETSELTNCSVVEPEYKPLGDLIFQTSEYSVKDVSENNRLYHLGGNHCKNNTESPQTGKIINVTDNSNNKTIHIQKHKLLSLGLMPFWLENFVNSTKEKYHPSKDFSDESFKALKTELDTYVADDPSVTHKSVPFALTFDICEHLRNLEITHGHKVSLNNLIIPCHLDEVPFVQEQFTSTKYLTGQKCPPTKCNTFENLSYFVPLSDVEALRSGQQTKPLLIQQINVDKDCNSYMKLASS